MNLVFFGTGAFGLPSLDTLKRSHHTLVAVVTSQDRPRGRNLKPQPSPVKAWAVQNRTPVFEFSRIHAAETLAELSKNTLDVMVVMDFGFILPRDFLSLPRLFPLNVHSSLLPRYRGAAPIAWAIWEGETQTGVTVIRMNVEMDAGDILLQKTLPIGADDDAVLLEKKLADLGAKALCESLDRTEKGQALFKPQDESKASMARKLTKADGLVAWNRHADNVLRQIKAVQGWPGAYSFMEGKRLLLLRAEVLEGGCQGALPGTVLTADIRLGITIATKDKPLRILVLQAEGRKALPAAEFLRGFRLSPGRLLE